MNKVEFITLEDEQGLVVSFALAPSGRESLTLLRAPHYEHLLPEQDRRATVSLSSHREEGDYVKSVLWQGSRVEVTSEKHKYVLEASAITRQDKDKAVAILRKLVREGELRVPAA